ncbi:MAG: hypothetical protein R3E96_09775 [Planctomycetota bacterium]
MHPTIDAYILMAGLMKEIGQSDEAVGMFQYLAETADKDDLFTIAIDGILNMLVDAPPRPKTVQWARRVTLERIARRHDKPYLFQLLSDLSAEVQDTPGQMLALESACPGRTRVAVRCYHDGGPGQGRCPQPSRRRRCPPPGDGPAPIGGSCRRGSALDLGEAFEGQGRPFSRNSTFALSRSSCDGPMYQRRAASKFEGADFVSTRGNVRSRVGDPTLGCAARLQGGGGPGEPRRGRRCPQLYARAMDLMLRRRPQRQQRSRRRSRGRVVRQSQRRRLRAEPERVWSGLVATMGAAELSTWWAAQTHLRPNSNRRSSCVQVDRGRRAEQAGTAGRFPRLQSRGEHDAAHGHGLGSHGPGRWPRSTARPGVPGR